MLPLDTSVLSSALGPMDPEIQLPSPLRIGYAASARVSPSGVTSIGPDQEPVGSAAAQLSAGAEQEQDCAHVDSDQRIR